MTRDKIVTALREHAERAVGNEWGASIITLGDNLSAAADLIEKMSAELADARNVIKKVYNGYDQLDVSNSRLMAANEKLAADRKALINELCQYSGKYKKAHKGACDGCR